MAATKLQQGYYRLEVKIKNRKHHSAVACASYRSDEKLYSERDGLYKSFRKHSIKPESFILKPEHAPKWALDRERLWNEVEKIEKHPNSQLAREVLLSLPKELSELEQTRLVKNYVQNEFVNHGMVADVSIHRNDKNNPHAHVLLTMRPFNENGEWDSKSKRVQQLDSNGNPLFNEKGQRVTKSVKTTDWDNRETLLRWRENWAKELNKVMKENGLNLSFSEKNFKEQGFEKLPLMRLTRQAYYLEKKAKEQAEKSGKVYEPVTYYGKQNKLIKEYNLLLTKEKATLEELKNAQNKIDVSNPEQIRVRNFIIEFDKQKPLSEQEKNAYSKIRKRAKTDVDYSVARKMLIEISEGNLHRKIENLKLKSKAQKHFISYVLKPEFAKDKGYTFSVNTNLNPQHFNDYVSEKINDYNQLNDEIRKLENVKDELLNNAKIVLLRETEKINAVFEFIYHDNMVDDKFTSPTLKYSAVQAFINDGFKAEVNRNYVGQKNVEQYYNKLARTKSLREKFIEVNNNLIKSLYSYRLHDRNIYNWLKYENDKVSNAPIHGTHLSNLEKREMARMLVFYYREMLDKMLPDVKEKYNINDRYSLKETVEILTGKDTELTNLYGDKNSIFVNEYDSQANKYKLINNEQNNSIPNPYSSHSIDSITASIVDGIFKADNDDNFYKTKKKKRKVKGKYRTVEENENEL